MSTFNELAKPSDTGISPGGQLWFKLLNQYGKPGPPNPWLQRLIELMRQSK